ncbi:MAG: IS200/IS605 family transposase, partial [Nitrososphaerota archaeon]
TKVFLINYHLVWTPKRRKPVLVGKIKERLEQVIKETAEEKGVGVLSLVVNPDHVHPLLSKEAHDFNRGRNWRALNT